MKQHTGDEIRTLMAEMPDDLVAALQAAHPDERVTEREARWWGYLMFARTGSYAGSEFSIETTGKSERFVQQFLSYVLEDRAANARYGLARRPWPDDGLDHTPAAK
jgi:hypothetical protein